MIFIWRPEYFLIDEDGCFEVGENLKRDYRDRQNFAIDHEKFATDLVKIVIDMIIIAIARGNSNEDFVKLAIDSIKNLRGDGESDIFLEKITCAGEIID